MLGWLTRVGHLDSVCVMLGDGTVYLIDINGKIVHTWRMPYPPGQYGYLTAREPSFTTERSLTIASWGGHPLKWAWRWRPIGTAGFSGKFANRIIITTAAERKYAHEDMFGRFFEVTPAGEIVGEYVNPYFGPANRPAQNQTNSVFRVYRYTAQEIALARQTS